MPRRSLLVAIAFVLLAACTSGAPSPRATISRAPAGSRTPSASPTATPVAARFDAARALATIRLLSEDIGRREATTAAYRRAGEHVEEAFRALGYSVRRRSLRVPAGISWGVAVPAGETFNVIAEPPGFDPMRRHAIVGAHLDTVPQSPGANDNASGVASVLELARLAAAEPPAVPVVFVAFAAEEPRGSGDDRHHYGSRAFVADLDAEERQALVGVISLDRVAYGSVVEVCVGGVGRRALQRDVLARAGELGYPADACVSRTSDHWSFEKAGIAGVRLGGERNPGYHSRRDTTGEIVPAQLRRVGRLAWETLRNLR